MQIYLDYSATTPTRLEIITAIQALLQQNWGNPSSLHDWGQRSAMILETARVQVAGLLNAANPDEIVFTSGGTEADYGALMGVAHCYTTPQHLIISSVEHPAIAETARRLEMQGWEITRLAVNRQGRVNSLALKAAIRPHTVLISVIYGQSEVGTLQPIEILGQIARDHGILFHTDAVQVVGRLPIDVQRLPVDLLSLSGHKIYGMQGAGALYVRSGVNLAPILAGGGQEGNLRSGTPALPAIAALGMAAEFAQAEMATETSRLRELRDYLFDLLADCPYLTPTGDRIYRLPHHASFILTQPITGKTFVRQLNLAGIGISAGSACHSGKLSPSPILSAMGYSATEALRGIRLTLGRDTTSADIDWTAMVIKQILTRLSSSMMLTQS